MSFKCAATRFACASVLLVGPWLTGIAHAQTLSLQTALQRALAANPRLTAAERDVGIASGQSIQAGALINPELSYEQDNCACYYRRNCDRICPSLGVERTAH